MSAFEKPSRKIDTFLTKADKHLKKIRNYDTNQNDKQNKIKDALNVLKQNLNFEKTD